MKKILSLLLCLCLFTTCKESDNTLLELSQSEFAVDDQAATLSVGITSNANWTVSTRTGWCTPSIQSGSNSGTLILTLEANTTTTERKGTVAVTAGSTSRTIHITQSMRKLLSLSQSLFVLNKDATTLQVEVTSNTDWTVSGGTDWCKPNITQGSNNGTLRLTVLANNEANNRTALIKLTAGSLTQTIEVVQGEEVDLATYHYKLPVIFHVLYSDVTDRIQYLDKGRLSSILTKVNTLYRGNASVPRPDMNLEFTLPTHTPQGALLDEPGVERVYLGNATLDCDYFMRSTNSLHASMLWNTNQYINVFVYTFTDENVMGISHLPYTPENNPLAGLYSNDYYFTGQPNYPHCVSINNTYIYKESTSKTYITTDVIATLAHELGHYLGLYHTFSQEGDNRNLCKDTDYCEDTPTYNNAEYTAWVDNYLKTVPKKDHDLAELIIKKDCSGVEFKARNIMDYSFCLFDQFTNDQHARIRHVLANSPMIPGPKNARAKSRNSSERPPIFYIE